MMMMMMMMMTMTTTNEKKNTEEKNLNFKCIGKVKAKKKSFPHEFLHQQKRRKKNLLKQHLN
jgi:hypothetical protein